MRSIAMCTPTRAVLPPAAAVPERGWSVPILYGLACPKASRHGAGTSVVAPSAPAAAAERPRNFRRVVLPLHHTSIVQGSSCQRSPIFVLLAAAPRAERPRRGQRGVRNGVAPIYTNRSDRARGARRRRCYV